MKIQFLTTIFFSLFVISQVCAQEEVLDSTKLVQFSGLVVDGSGDELEPIPFIAVAVEGTSRGVYTDWEGFFSIVVEQGEKVTFSGVGYKSVEFVVPDTLTDKRYSLVQLMTADTINLPETVVFPWPSREHFKLEFLAMNVDQELVSNAEKNLDQNVLAAIAKATPMDGNENSDYYLRQQANSYYSAGQLKPMRIFDPLAWRDFIRAWKNGDFKNKK